MNNKEVPSSYARHDDQGNLQTCTRFALSKSIADGLMRKMFVPGRQVDIEQEQIKTALLNEHKDGEGKWPEDFHDKYYQLQGVRANYWKETLSVVKTDPADILLDLKSGKPTSTYVLVYRDRSIGLHWHCVYVRDYEPLGRVYHCINSHGSSSPTCVPLSQAGNILYRVRCAAQSMGTESLDTNLEQLLHKLGLLHLRDEFESNSLTSMEDIRDLSREDLKE